MTRPGARFKGSPRGRYNYATINSEMMRIAGSAGRKSPVQVRGQLCLKRAWGNTWRKTEGNGTGKQRAKERI